MDGFELVNFAFSIDGGLDAVKHLEDMLSSGHWSDRPLDYNDERTMLLLRLLRMGDIAVYKRVYSHVEETPELWQRAEDINMFMNKRYVGGTMLDIADIFSGYEFDGRRTEFNSLFFPELKAFVRLYSLPPDRLLGLLERDGCETVFLFPPTYANEENAYYAFTLAMPKELYLEELEKTNERIVEMMYEISRNLMEKHGNIFPAIEFLEEE